MLLLICVAVSIFLDSSPATSVVESEGNASSASNCANGDTLNPTLQDSDIMQNILASQGNDEAKNKEGKLFSTTVCCISSF